MRNELKGLMMTAAFVATACGGTIKVEPSPTPSLPWESHVAILGSKEPGCTGRYIIELNPGSLTKSLKDEKVLSKFPYLNLEVSISPRGTSTVDVIAVINDRSIVDFNTNALSNDQHEFKTAWNNCVFTDVIWDGQRINVKPVTP